MTFLLCACAVSEPVHACRRGRPIPIGPRLPVCVHLCVCVCVCACRVAVFAGVSLIVGYFAFKFGMKSE